MSYEPHAQYESRQERRGHQHAHRSAQIGDHQAADLEERPRRDLRHRPAEAEPGPPEDSGHERKQQQRHELNGLDHDAPPARSRRPQRISAKETMPVGADEYATTLMRLSWTALPWAAPAAIGIVSLPAPQKAPSTYAARIANVE